MPRMTLAFKVTLELFRYVRQLGALEEACSTVGKASDEQLDEVIEEGKRAQEALWEHVQPGYPGFWAIMDGMHEPTDAMIAREESRLRYKPSRKERAAIRAEERQAAREWEDALYDSIVNRKPMPDW